MAYRFLSEEWMDAARKIRDEYGKGPKPAFGMKMNQVVTDVPFGEGTINAHVDTTGDEIVLDLGHLEEPDVTVTLDYDTAKAIVVDGDPEAGWQAFMSGRIMVEGDASMILALQATAEDDPDARAIATRIREITK
ncbi:MAG: SCP2 sterol-binding domain-containing protein [Acidimicrobiia bacterium]